MEKSYTLFKDASKYELAYVLTQTYIHIIDGKEKTILHPITYMSGLFRGSQLNWTAYIKQAYAIYISVKMLVNPHVLLFPLCTPYLFI